MHLLMTDFGCPEVVDQGFFNLFFIDERLMLD